MPAPDSSRAIDAYGGHDISDTGSASPGSKSDKDLHRPS
ncbi:hypothetical protein CHELA20_53176 [Hyphomicrobiales bacterium]|nr:hypothetical protein CHELA20_53176 [Hyphomicrobiales bacterium]